MESYTLRKLFALSFVVVLVLVGCESDQTTNTAPTVVSVGTVYANMTATAVAEATHEALFQDALDAAATIAASTKTPPKPGGRVVDMLEPDGESCERRISLRSCVVIEFKPSFTETLYEITTLLDHDCHRAAKSTGFISASGPCGTWWNTYR